LQNSWSKKISLLEDRMQLHRKAARIAALAVLVTVAAVSLVKVSSATGSIGNITKADLAGNWLVTLYGQGGCGVGTSLVTFNLSASGTGTATNSGHTVGCGDTTTTGNTFTISTLSSNGSGTAGLTCGTGCGFSFTIQVAADRSTFTLVDITDPNNFLQGTAVHQ
jgi:hypothetical protein